MGSWNGESLERRRTGNVSQDDSTPEYFCLKCGSGHGGQSYTTFLLGLQKFKCSNCHQINTLPMQTHYRVIYWLILLVFAGLSVVSLANGELPLPGIITILAAVALMRDFTLRQQWTDARAKRMQSNKEQAV
jgi:hypothetical protein